MTNWTKVINDNYDDIVAKFIEVEMSMCDVSRDLHTALAIKPDGTLYTWDYVGSYSCPYEVWAGTDMLIHSFTGWEIEDVTGDLSDNDILDHCRGLVTQPWKALLQYKRSGECWSMFFKYHYPAVFESIYDIVMDNMLDNFSNEAVYYISQTLKDIHTYETYNAMAE